MIVKLEPRMMRLLCRLAETRGRVVSSQQLLDSVWPGVVVGPASVYQAISALRKILGDSDTTPTYIATVLRKGYRLLAAVEPAAEVTVNAPASAEENSGAAGDKAPQPQPQPSLQRLVSLILLCRPRDYRWRSPARWCCYPLRCSAGTHSHRFRGDRSPTCLTLSSFPSMCPAMRPKPGILSRIRSRGK